MAQETNTQPKTRQRYRVGPTDQIPDKTGILVDLGEREVGIFRHEGKLHAYANRCVHQGGPVCTGELVGATKLELDERKQVVAEHLDETEMRLVCPWHGWEYDLATGEVVHNRRFRLQRFDVTVEDGIVYIDA